jgi:hypothetical protein
MNFEESGRVTSSSSSAALTACGESGRSGNSVTGTEFPHREAAENK